jgi:hypothetical protein
MSTELTEIAGKIEGEAKEKYSGAKLAGEIQDYNPLIYSVIVDYFKGLKEEYPHLEAFEIYEPVAAALQSNNPSKDQIIKAIEGY